MKLRPFRIGQVIITPKMSLSLIAAFFILGIGIGATAAEPNNSKFALLICTIISVRIIAHTFLKNKKAE